MPFKLANEFIHMMVEKGLIPDDTIAVDFRFTWDNLPIMTVERMPDAEETEYFIELIGSAEELEPYRR